MIQKMDSQGFMNILESAQQQMANMDKKIETIKTDIERKLVISKHEQAYINKQLNDMQTGAFTQQEYMKVFSREGKGVYETYGAVIHPKFIKAPIDIFNLKVSGNGNVFFRNDVKVKVNGIESDQYKNVLKHDSFEDKGIFFEEFTTEYIKVECEVDLNNLLGATRFNMIEFDSFLPGSFEISTIEIFTMNANRELNLVPMKIKDIKRAGKGRLVLPEKVEFYKVIFYFRQRYSTIKGDTTIYPFGLKHIYFYDADFKTDSYMVTTITSQNPIAIIKDVIKVKTLAGERTSTIEEEGIQVYLNNSNGILDSEVYASTPTQRNEITKTVRTLYAKIPLKMSDYIGMVFNIETR